MSSSGSDEQGGNRAEQIVETYGRYTLTITDDCPIPTGKTLARDVRVTLHNAGELESKFRYPAYRKYTLLAHWKDGLSHD